MARLGYILPQRAMKFDSHSAAEWRDLAVEAGRSWQSDGAPSMGAALAFYTLFSMAPLLLLAISIAGIAIGTDTARDMLMTQLTSLMGDEAAATVRSVLERANERSEGWWSAFVSIATLVVGASTVFAELRRDLDRIWKIEAPVKSGLWNFVVSRVLSVGMVATIGFLLMVSLAVSATVTALGSMWAGSLPGGGAVPRLIEFAGSFLVITGLFAMIYRLLPSVKIAWGDVWVGAALTSLLFWIGKYLIGIYIGRSAVASPFGAAGTLVVVIVWVYYSAQIFFLGAELTRAYAVHMGSLKNRVSGTTST
jgi:membrane protein